MFKKCLVWLQEPRWSFPLFDCVFVVACALGVVLEQEVSTRTGSQPLGALSAFAFVCLTSLITGQMWATHSHGPRLTGGARKLALGAMVISAMVSTGVGIGVLHASGFVLEAGALGALLLSMFLKAVINLVAILMRN